MTEWQLAQLNVATMRYPREDARVAEFFERIDATNALADEAPGFVWRLQDDTGNATDIEVGDNPYEIVNMSVWESADALSDFVYRSLHKELIRKRKDWFERPMESHQVLWWIAAGLFPSVDEGMQRLQLLRETGPTADAFTFKNQFPPQAIA